MVSDAQKKATNEYRKKNVKQIAVRFYPSEKDIFEHMEKQGGRAAYIKALIRADMEKSQTQ